MAASFKFPVNRGGLGFFFSRILSEEATLTVNIVEKLGHPSKRLSGPFVERVFKQQTGRKKCDGRLDFSERRSNAFLVRPIENECDWKVF